MEINYQDFIDVCPVSMSPGRDIFFSIRSEVDSRLAFVRGVVTAPVMSRIDLLDTMHDEDHDRLTRLRQHIKAYVCVSAFYNSIPQLDLVLTETGFGVVSNQNVAPASADRVANLRKELRRMECDQLDHIIDLLRPIVDWTKSTHGGYFFSSLFWRGAHVSVFGVSNPTRDNLEERMADIEEAAADMELYLSPELYQALIHAEATDSATPMQLVLITMWRAATAAWCEHHGTWHKHRHQMLRFIEDNISEFPEYFGSRTYKANHFERYENKKDDSCFFFG